MRVFETGRLTEVARLAFSPDGARLAAGAENVGVVVYDLGGGAPIHLGGTHSLHRILGFSADGRAVHAVTQNGRTGFDPTTGKPVSRGPAHPSAPGVQRWFVESADGARLVTTHFEYPTTHVVGWAAAAGGWERAWQVEMGHTWDFSLVGDRLVHLGSPVPGGWSYVLMVRDVATGELVATGRYEYSGRALPHLRPDGRQVVAAHDKMLLVWDARRPGKPAAVRNDSRRHFTAAAYHPGGRYLFTTSNDATVTVWDSETWERVGRYDWDVGRLRAVAVSRDGLLAAAGSDRGRVVVWDVEL